MKKMALVFVILTCLTFLVIFTSCSREKAMEQLMADPQMSQLIMDKIWETPETKQMLVQKVMEDPESMNKLKESLIADSTKAAMMLDMLMANEDLQEMIKEKTADLHKRTGRR
jgi:hypothetical protein